MTTLITGPTGMMGATLVSAVGALTDGPILLLIRPGAEPSPVRFGRVVRDLAVGGLPESQRRRLLLVEGDLLLPDLGVSARDADRIVAETTHILHAGAATRFSLSLAEARRANVDGTLRVLELAARCRRLEGLGFVSTAYVAGTRSGTILEADLAPTEFINTYEQAKFEAEALLRHRMGELPIAVYRLSTIVGSSATGLVPKMNAVHRAIELAYRGLVPMVPGHPDTPVELLDLEYAAGAVATLFLTAFEAGKTYHVVAGPERSYTLQQFVDETYRIVAELDPQWAARKIEPPPIVTEEVFTALRVMIEGVKDPEGIEIIQAILHFAPQMFYPKRFDTTNRDRAVPALAAPPDIRDYFPKILEYCIRTQWLSPDEAGI